MTPSNILVVDAMMARIKAYVKDHDKRCTGGVTAA